MSPWSWAPPLHACWLLTGGWCRGLAPITDALEARGDWSALSKGAGLVAEHVLKPLFALLRDSAARSHHGQLVGQQPPERCPEGSRAEA